MITVLLYNPARHEAAALPTAAAPGTAVVALDWTGRLFFSGELLAATLAFMCAAALIHAARAARRGIG